jgi:hypothetical protein
LTTESFRFLASCFSAFLASFFALPSAIFSPTSFFKSLVLARADLTVLPTFDLTLLESLDLALASSTSIVVSWWGESIESNVLAGLTRILGEGGVTVMLFSKDILSGFMLDESVYDYAMVLVSIVGMFGVMRVKCDSDDLRVYREVYVL